MSALGDVGRAFDRIGRRSDPARALDRGTVPDRGVVDVAEPAADRCRSTRRRRATRGPSRTAR